MSGPTNFHWRLLSVALFTALFLASALPAQSHDEQARRITEKPAYKGYRVGRPPGSDPQSGDGQTGEDGGQGGRGGEDGGYRRGSGSQGPPQRDSGAGPGGGGGGGGGSGLSLPSWIGSLFEIVAWVLLIAGAAVALFFIIKALLGIKFKRKPKSKKSKREKKDSAESEVAAIEEEPIQIDEQVFEDALQVALREYNEALARQDFAGATLLAYRIFWLRAGWEGCVSDSDVKTWRDALRMVRGSDTRQEVRRLLPLVERVRYADYKPDQSEFQVWTQTLEAIPPQGVLR
ncbi:MAG: hypothetical protein R3E76_06435 [Planctomycetota bacterium]